MHGKGLANNYARKCLDGRNAAACVDEGKNVSPANQRSSSTNDRKQYTVEHRNFENWSSKGPIVLKI